MPNTCHKKTLLSVFSFLTLEIIFNFLITRPALRGVSNFWSNENAILIFLFFIFLNNKLTSLSSIAVMNLCLSFTSSTAVSAVSSNTQLQTGLPPKTFHPISIHW